MNTYLSKYFQIVSIRQDCIEIKSAYHFWRIIERDGVFFLHHKHNQNNPYHAQRSTPFPSLYSIKKYILRHDEYVSEFKIFD